MDIMSIEFTWYLQESRNFATVQFIVDVLSSSLAYNLWTRANLFIYLYITIY